ncbi:hypothetical protein B0J12DRAFT_687144, partial [Macrophomina phaseolina]
KLLLEQPPTDLDVAKLVDLYSSISRFAGISYLASKLMKIARAERDKAPTNDLLSRNRDISKGSLARIKLKDELVNYLVYMNKDRETVSRELENNIRKGKILNLLLSPPDNRCLWIDIRFLSLFPLYKSAYDHRDSRLFLDLMAYGPPKAIKITLLNFNEALLGFFGKSLFTVPDEITIYLKDAYDGELWDIKPFDVTRFFEPVGRIVTTPRRLEFL